MLTKYFLVTQTTPKLLSEAVSNFLKDGWTLYGNPYTFIETTIGTQLGISTPATLQYCQALTKE